MGVHGLTTFIDGLQKSNKAGYREKIIIRGDPVVIDGSNMMYYLYFDGKTPVVGRGGNKADLNATSLPKAHLYGGDWIQYAQNVRYFFQQLKHCNITAIVIFDGAYDKDKIEVARRRFATSVYENVKKGSVDAIPEPGKTYTPIFLKSVFLEVLSEQKIPHYQTVGEADPTIALVAKLLGRCPILSSDSDFFIYADAIPVSLKSLKFSLKQAKADLIFEGKLFKGAEKGPAQKVWTLEGEYVSMEKICRMEFGLDNQDMLPLAAVIIGNDSIITNFFKQFKQGDSLKKRIETVFKWLSRQKSVSVALNALVNHVSPEKRQLVTSAMRYNLEMYRGENGEKRIWELIKQDVDLSLWIDSKLADRICQRKTPENQNVPSGIENLTLCLGSQGNIKCIVRQPAIGTNIGQEKAKILTDDNGNLKAEVVTRIIPDWYRFKHVRCEFQTYLLNIIKNQVVFLPPQVEMYGSYSSHAFSIPIIKVTAGILLGSPDEPVTLESHDKGRATKIVVYPVVEINDFGPLPALRNHGDIIADTDKKSVKGDFSKSISHDHRLSLILAALCIKEKNAMEKFYEGWPVSYRVWVATLMYYIKKKLGLDVRDDSHFPIPSLAVVTAIFLCIIKNLIVNPGKVAEAPGNKCLSAILNLHNLTNTDSDKLKKIREFYQKFEDFSETIGDKAKKIPYDISLSYSLSQYLCVVYHTEMLNNLMGNPLKSPKVRYTVNNFFIYNFARHITNQIEKSENGIDFNKIISAATGVEEIDDILSEFINVCYNISNYVKL